MGYRPGVAIKIVARRQAHPVLPWQVTAEALPQLPAEVLLFRRRREVHRPSQHDTHVRLAHRPDR